jgi:predicted alpha/beta-fold hydrolase
MIWSLEEYCQGQQPLDLETLTSSTREFLLNLDLPSVHPFCQDGVNSFHVFGEDVPPMGSLGTERFHGQTFLQCVISLWYMIAPPLMAMAQLWLRLFASVVGPMGIVYLTFRNVRLRRPRQLVKYHENRVMLSVTVILTVASSLVLMTDTLYVLENGRTYGATLFLLAILVALQTCLDARLDIAAVAVFGLVLLSIHLTWDSNDNQLVFGNKVDQVDLSEGLYYSKNNALVARLVSHWPETYQKYDLEHGATRWLITGDSRTGIPFLVNHLSKPEWQRFFLPVDGEGSEMEYVALDISFPSQGHDFTKPVYLVLHGLNGGSNEEYIRDLTFRRNAENSTVVVMVARGLMDLPIRGWSLFNGARTSDAQTAAIAVRKALGEQQILVGVGYSMGAIILANTVAFYGTDCALDGAVAISGGLDMRYQEYAGRAQLLWQPMLAETLRDEFLLGKWGKRVRARLSDDEFLRMLRATHVTEIDTYAVVPYNGFNSLEHYYREMSALGDIDHDSQGMIPMKNSGKIHNVIIPLLIVHAYDDPLVTWRATCQNEGFMHPQNLANSGSGNLMLLVTKGGGHVGWPLGWMPMSEKWRWMSDVAMSFTSALSEARGLKPVV